MRVASSLTRLGLCTPFSLRLKDERVKETTVLHRIFGGYFRSQVKCSVCGHESNTYDAFLDLSLVSVLLSQSQSVVAVVFSVCLVCL